MIYEDFVYDKDIDGRPVTDGVVQYCGGLRLSRHYTRRFAECPLRACVDRDDDDDGNGRPGHGNQAKRVHTVARQRCEFLV